MVHPSGVEPDGKTNKRSEIPGSGHKNGHAPPVNADSDLEKILAVWPSLPKSLKAAVLSIIKSVEDV